MEVHKHPHDVTHKKKWGEYFLEFLMIFLAVTLGFFAESFREHLVDKEKEKQYMAGLYQNLRTDTSGINVIIKSYEKKIHKLDSLIDLLSSNNYHTNSGLIYYLGRHVARRFWFTPNNSAYIQLTSSGGMRLIKNSDILDSLEGYRATLAYVESNQNTDHSRSEEFQKMSARLFDIKVFNEIVMNDGTIMLPSGNPPLLDQTKIEINELCISLHYIVVNSKYCYEAYKQLLKKAENLLIFIQKEYHLENK